MTLKELVKDNKVRFIYYRSGELWYEVYDEFYRLKALFEFPVPISDCGDAVFLKEDKAILFMRYIRKHLESIEKAKKEQNV